MSDTRFAIAADSPETVRAGQIIAEGGGNAVDAAVTTALTMHVVAPAWSTIGGGAFIVIHLKATGQTVAIDAREVAPRKAITSPEMFDIGYQSIGVPGCLAGYQLAHHRVDAFSAEVLAAVQLFRARLFAERTIVRAASADHGRVAVAVGGERGK